MSAGAITGASAVGDTTGAGAFGALNSDDFIKVMLSELSNQDPFDPQDSSALLEQLSSLRNIESQLALQEELGDLVNQSRESQLSLEQQLESLILQNQVSSAGGLIGKLVSGPNDAKENVEGLVVSVRVQDNKTLLELDTGQTLSMDKVEQISNFDP